MTDEQVIEALVLCANTGSCRECPLYSMHSANCIIKLMNNTLDLIKRQQAEIEQWKEEANRYQNLWCDAEKDISNARIEAQKDFAERLKEHMCSYDFSNYHYFKAVDEDTLDEVLKEMTEEQNNV